MSSFLRGLWKGNHSKHKKLLEDWALAGKDAENEVNGLVALSLSSEKESVNIDLGIRFHVKYLGSTLVETPNGNAATAEAIKTVIALAKARGKKLQRVIIKVNLRGIKVLDAVTEEIQFDISIYRISYCSADATYSHVFAFIATNPNETMECHAFLCRKRKMAQCATLAIAKTFSTAYEIWQLSHEDAEEERSNLPTKREFTTTNEDHDHNYATGYQRKASANNAKKNIVSENVSSLIDFSREPENLPVKEKLWVSFEDDDNQSGRKRPKKAEEKIGDLWDESYSSNTDLLSLS